jgi:hypothetical protein
MRKANRPSRTIPATTKKPALTRKTPNPHIGVKNKTAANNSEHQPAWFQNRKTREEGARVPQNYQAYPHMGLTMPSSIPSPRAYPESSL